MCVNHIPSPTDNARRKVEHIYTGPLDTELAESMFDCSPEVITCRPTQLPLLSGTRGLSVECIHRTTGHRAS